MKTTDFGPGTTPLLIRWFIILACIVSISSGLLQGILNHLKIFPGPQELLSLSWWGISNGFLWQPFTYALILDLPSNDISFSFFVGLIFNVYVIWVLGSGMYNTLGVRSLAQYMGICSVLSGILTMTLLRLLGNYDMLTGMTSFVIILLTAWCTRFPNSAIFLFMLIPINSLSLATILISMITFYALFNGEWSNVLLYVMSACVAYLYTILVWGWRNPLPWMGPVDNWLLNLRSKFTHDLPTMSSNDDSDSVVIDIDTGKPTLQDDAFVDEMLEKISKNGEDSLSWREKQRLQQIAERKKASRRG